jgi:hypothetical protein
MTTTARLVDRFHDSGSVDGKKNSGRLRALTNEKVEGVRQQLMQTPTKNSRNVPRRGVYHFRVHRALQKVAPASVSCLYSERTERTGKGKKR